MTSSLKQPGSVAPEPPTSAYNFLAGLGFRYLHPGGRQASLILYRSLNLSAADHVLVAGCGTGRALATLVESFGCQVTGLDLSTEMIRRSANLVARRGINRSVILERGDVCRLPFDSGTFTAVVDEGVAMFVERERALAEYVRVTRPGGRVGLLELGFLVEPTPAQRATVSRDLGGGEFTQAHSLEGWKKLLESAGLSDIRSASQGLETGLGQVLVDEGLWTWSKVLLRSRLDPAIRQKLEAHFGLLDRWRGQMCAGIFTGQKT